MHFDDFISLYIYDYCRILFRFWLLIIYCRRASLCSTIYIFSLSPLPMISFDSFSSFDAHTVISSVQRLSPRLSCTTPWVDYTGCDFALLHLFRAIFFADIHSFALIWYFYRYLMTYFRLQYLAPTTSSQPSPATFRVLTHTSRSSMVTHNHYAFRVSISLRLFILYFDKG